jgi:hypothetical protein
MIGIYKIKYILSIKFTFWQRSRQILRSSSVTSFTQVKKQARIFATQGSSIALARFCHCFTQNTCMHQEFGIARWSCLWRELFFNGALLNSSCLDGSSLLNVIKHTRAATSSLHASVQCIFRQRSSRQANFPSTKYGKSAYNEQIIR